MNKNFKEFGKYLSLLFTVYFINETFKHYVPISFTSTNAWIGAILFAGIFYLMSK